MTIKNSTSALLGVLLLGAVLRLYGLGDESIWIDEAQTVTYAVQSFPEIIKYCARDVHPPLFLFFMKIWTDLFGISEVALRMPSAIFGIISVWLTYLVAEKLLSGVEQYRNTGVLAAVFMAVSYMAINFSQEARSYSMMLCAILVSCHALLCYLEGPTRKSSLYYAASVALMLYVHTFAVFVIFFHQLYFLCRLTTFSGIIEKIFHWIGVNILALLLFSPWLYFLVMQVLAKLSGEGPGSWVQVPDIHVAYRTFVQLAGGTYPLMVFVAILVAALVYTIRKSSPRFQGNWSAGTFLGLWFFCTVVFPFVVSLILSPIYVERYAIQFLPAGCIFIALLIQYLPASVKRYAVAAFLGATCITLFQYYTMLDKEQWREVAEYLAENVKQGEPVVLSAPWIYEPLVYYLGDESPHFVQAFQYVDIEGDTRNSDRVWLVQAHEFFSDPDGNVPTMLGESRGITKHKDFKDGVETNPVLVHFQSIRVTRFDGGASGDEFLANNPFAGRAQLVEGLPDAWLDTRMNVPVSQDAEGEKFFRIGRDSKLKYLLKNKTKIGEGALSFWFKPHWDSIDKKHVLFMGKGDAWDKNTVFVETTEKGGLRAVFFGFDGYIGVCEGPAVDWEKQDWRSLALVWKRDYAALYLNGALYAEGGLSRPFQSDFQTIHLGSDHQNGFIASALYDDLTVYSSPLSGYDVEQLYVGQVKALADFAFDFDLKGVKSSKALEETSGIDVSADAPFFAKAPTKLSDTVKKGELAFSFTPDWDGTDGKQHVFITFFGRDWNDGSLFLEKTPQGFLQLIRWEGGKVSTVFGQDITDWKKGSQHSVLMRWSPTHLGLTIDGKNYSGVCKPPATGQFRFLVIGNNDGFTLPVDGVFKGLKFR
ncbi:MAG: glycosyltransferase family 39 protein [Desulfovibrio sp.]